MQMKNNGKIRSMLDEARFLHNNLGESKKAVSICNKILEIDASCRDAMLIKAGALNGLFRLDESKELINKIIKKWPEHWEGYYLLALHCFALNEDEEGSAAIDKSLELNENFDNIMIKAQMLYMANKGDYMKYVDKARRIDKKRAENFMKSHFVYDVNLVQPTFSEFFDAIKQIMKRKIK